MLAGEPINFHKISTDIGHGNIVQAVFVKLLAFETWGMEYLKV